MRLTLDHPVFGRFVLLSCRKSLDELLEEIFKYSVYILSSGSSISHREATWSVVKGGIPYTVYCRGGFTVYYRRGVYSVLEGGRIYISIKKMTSN